MSNLRLRSPVLIGGSGSSGSTLLASILDSHPEIACGPEMSFFNKKAIYGAYGGFQAKLSRWMRRGIATDGYCLYPSFLRVLDAYALSERQVVSWAKEADDLLAFVRSLQSYVLRHTHTRVFAEKTPSNCYCFHEFLELFPDAKLLHIVRDGRDVVCSFMKRGMSLFRATSLWLYNTSAALLYRNLPQYFELTYEELVTDPTETIQRVCEHIGVRYFAAMLDRNSPSLLSRDGISTWRNAPNEPITSSSVGRFEEELDDSDLSCLYGVRLTEYGARKLGVTEPTSVAALLARLGYPQSHRPPTRYPLRALRESIADQIRRNRNSLKGGWGIRRPLTWVSLSC